MDPVLPARSTWPQSGMGSKWCHHRTPEEEGPNMEVRAGAHCRR